MNWARMLSVAEARVERRTLTGEELRGVINAVHIGIEPPPPAALGSQPYCKSVH
jgi:hypothetical protein